MIDVHSNKVPVIEVQDKYKVNINSIAIVLNSSGRFVMLYNVAGKFDDLWGGSLSSTRPLTKQLPIPSPRFKLCYNRDIVRPLHDGGCSLKDYHRRASERGARSQECYFDVV